MNKPANLRLTTTICLLLACACLIGAIERDPTRPPFAATTEANGTTHTAQPFSVTAIFDYPGYRTAIVNNRLVKVGDQIDEFTITSISPYTVELTGQDHTKQVIDLLSDVKIRARPQQE